MAEAAPSAPRAPRGRREGGPAPGPLGAALLGVALVVPLAGLALLLTRPALDAAWEHHPAHFWLVLLTAALAAILASATGQAAVQRGDARVLLVSLAFLSSAGFLGLHALATPQVLLDEPNAGFVIATPVGITLGSVAALVSAVDLSGPRAARALRIGRAARVVLVVVMLAWAVASLADLPPLAGSAETAGGWLSVLAVAGVPPYLLAAAGYVRLWRERGSLMLPLMASAFVLLAEALIAIAVARNWHLSWWEWHVLLLTATALVAWGARSSWREERFADLYTAGTRSGEREISVLFADLQGFTTFSEAHQPAEVTAMLNEYFAAAVPAVVEVHGGDVDRIIGDALMVTFNKRGDQPDHARRAAAAGLALQAVTEPVASAHPGWPRFRVGVNTGPVTVSVLGTGGGRTHTVIGDTVNIASRIEGRAPAGGVAIGPETQARLPEAVTTPLGSLELKGKTRPVDVHLLLSLPGGARGSAPSRR